MHASLNLLGCWKHLSILAFSRSVRTFKGSKRFKGFKRFKGCKRCEKAKASESGSQWSVAGSVEVVRGEEDIRQP